MTNIILTGIALIAIKYLFDLYKIIKAHLRRERIWKNVPVTMRINYDQRNVK
jgi:hypothetical protein